MAKLNKNDVLHVAELAKLKLSDSEVLKFPPQLTEIVNHISELQKVDTTNVEPTAQTTGLTNVLREDVIKQSSIDQDGALSATDNVYNGLFKVPAILEGRTDKWSYL